jgi:hypothetical protein
LASEIKIPGIVSIARDTAFDDEANYRSGGIRLRYENTTNKVEGMKEGILLEVGFDDVNPNKRISISSWAYDKALESKTEMIDNRAFEIKCYHPGYTFIEKLQTIATKFRMERSEGRRGVNFMRQYYDVYCLLEQEETLKFIGTEEYLAHKEKRFPKTDFEIPVCRNEAFLLSDPALRSEYTSRYKATEAMYYQGQPEFDELIKRIGFYIDKL